MRDDDLHDVEFYARRSYPVLFSIRISRIRYWQAWNWSIRVHFLTDGRSESKRKLAPWWSKIPKDVDVENINPLSLAIRELLLRAWFWIVDFLAVFVVLVASSILWFICGIFWMEIQSIPWQSRPDAIITNKEALDAIFLDIEELNNNKNSQNDALSD